MAASGRFMNWSSVTFTPTSGSPVTITEVQNVTIDPRVVLKGASGDGDLAPTAKTLEYIDPHITVETEDIKTVNALGFGTRGSFEATHNDFYNGSGSGAMTYTVSNCIVAGGQRSGAHRQTGRATLICETYSSDGTTSPIAYSYAA